MTGPRRHVPLRTCVICGSKAPKKELVRIVAAPGGAVRLDPTGKESGRGTYVCARMACTQADLKRGRLEQVLRRGVSDGDWSELASALDGLSPGV